MNFSVQALYSWYRNTLRHPKYRWWIILGTLVYLVSPFDLLPDVFPIVGEIDDVAIITLLIAELSQFFLEKARNRQPTTADTAAPGSETVEVHAETVDEG